MDDNAICVSSCKASFILHCVCVAMRCSGPISSKFSTSTQERRSALRRPMQNLLFAAPSHPPTSTPTPTSRGPWGVWDLQFLVPFSSSLSFFGGRLVHLTVATDTMKTLVNLRYVACGTLRYDTKVIDTSCLTQIRCSKVWMQLKSNPTLVLAQTKESVVLDNVRIRPYSHTGYPMALPYGMDTVGFKIIILKTHSLSTKSELVI